MKINDKNKYEKYKQKK